MHAAHSTQESNEWGVALLDKTASGCPILVFA
jgi:hypothetical protein